MMSAGAALRLATENAASLAALSGECLGRLMTSPTLHGSLQILRLWLPRPGPGRALHRVRPREEGAQLQRHHEAGGQDLEEAPGGQGEPRGD